MRGTYLAVASLLFSACAGCLSRPPSPDQALPLMSPELDVRCSSVLLDATHVLTAAHCIKEPVVMVSCAGRFLPATVIKYSQEAELAELELQEACDQRFTKVASSNPVQGTQVQAIGCPLGKCGRITQGVVSDYGASMGHAVLITDTPTWFGNSGGGLYNMRGELVGIASQISCDFRPFSMGGATVPGQYCLGYFIPAVSIKAFLDSAETI